MKINMKRVGECVTLEAEGTPDELAKYSRLAGLIRGSDGSCSSNLTSFSLRVNEDGDVVHSIIASTDAAINNSFTNNISRHLY